MTLDKRPPFSRALWNADTVRGVARYGAALWMCVALAPLTVNAQPTAGRATGGTDPKALMTRPGASGPSWSDLNKDQRLALKPLAAEWNGLSEAQRRKWLALSRNFEKLPPPEQQKLQAGMGEWVALSAKDRSRARLNFAETKNLSVEEKQAKWQAYQALSESERRALAEQAPRRRLPGAATAVQPVAPPRLAQMPATLGRETKAPRISTAPHQVDPNTLLPQVDARSAGLRDESAQ
jgi:hypothetical protein